MHTVLHPVHEGMSMAALVVLGSGPRTGGTALVPDVGNTDGVYPSSSAVHGVELQDVNMANNAMSKHRAHVTRTMATQRSMVVSRWSFICHEGDKYKTCRYRTQRELGACEVNAPDPLGVVMAPVAIRCHSEAQPEA